MNSPITILLVVLALLALAGIVDAGSNLDPPKYAWCSKNITTLNKDITIDKLCGDWLLVYTTDIAFRKGTSVFGPGLPYDYCDVLNCNNGCMGIGISIVQSNGTKQLGYIYGFNAFTDTWTVAQFMEIAYQNPSDTPDVGFRLNFLHYVQIPDKDLFVNSKAAACGSTKVVRSGPIYRSSSFVILAADPALNWLVILYCDAFYGFFVDYPLIQIVVKKSYMNQVSYPISTCPFYEDIKDNIQKYGFNIFAADFNLIYHDEGGNYPSSVSWDSLDWEGDCNCPSNS